MTRRKWLTIAAAALQAAESRKTGVAVEGYIFQQYAERRKQPLRDVVGEVLPMARATGFRNIELSPVFFEGDLRTRLPEILEAQGLRMPSLYVGGAMHDVGSAERTTQAALEYGALCKPFGCTAIVNNPDPKPGGERKTDAELDVQADALNRMGRNLAQHGFALRVHHHTPQLVEQAREWRHILKHTDPAYVHICVDVDWAYEGGFAPLPFLREVGERLQELHVRSARNKIWLEDLEDSDIDYRAVSAYLKEQALTPLIVVELAYRPETVVTRSLEEDLRVSRVYAEKVFGVKANG